MAIIRVSTSSKEMGLPTDQESTSVTPGQEECGRGGSFIWTGCGWFVFACQTARGLSVVTRSTVSIASLKNPRPEAEEDVGGPIDRLSPYLLSCGPPHLPVL
jgi:hypothetical protein